MTLDTQQSIAERIARRLMRLLLLLTAIKMLVADDS